MNTETLISIGYYASSLGFLVASWVTFDAFRKAGPSSLKTVLEYLIIGTGTFFVITIFQKLGADFFGITDQAMDIWWHIMFYMAMVSYYFSFKTLADMGRAGNESMPVSSGGGAKVWGIICAVLLVIIFLIPSYAAPWVNIYLASKLAELGAHHFVAFAIAGVVGAYLLSAKIFLGQVGRAIASPMIIAVWALSLQHMWELLNESWKVIVVTSNVGEGVEKIFLTVAAICVIYSALRLKALAKAA